MQIKLAWNEHETGAERQHTEEQLATLVLQGSFAYSGVPPGAPLIESHYATNIAATAVDLLAEITEGSSSLRWRQHRKQWGRSQVP
mgnify:CR=1 FL=1